ncbi:MAG: hypothetical protein GY701_12500, partial [Sulfitobacter sp.]|nr:hypothetical protein [Sulfitobacter sp.]
MIDGSGPDWITEAPGDSYHYVDAGPDGLVISSNGGSALQVLGSSNTGAEGKTIFYKDVDVDGDFEVSASKTLTCGALSASSLSGGVLTQLDSEYVTRSSFSAGGSVSKWWFGRLSGVGAGSQTLLQLSHAEGWDANTSQVHGCTVRFLKSGGASQGGFHGAAIQEVT